MSLFDEIIPRSEQSRKNGQRLEMFGTTDLLPLWIADMDFATPPAIREAMSRVIEEPVQGYSLEYPAWRSSVREWYSYRYDAEIADEWIHFVPGVIRGIVFAIHALTQPGDSVLTCTPVYDPYPNLVQTSGRRLLQSQLTERNGSFEFDWVDFEQKAREASLFLLCSPHNPGGVVWDRETLSRIARICKEAGTLVVADEIHGDLTPGPQRHIPFFTVSQAARENCVVFTSTSKTFNTPGVQGGIALVADAALRERFYGYLEGCYLAEANLIQQAAMSAAFSSCRPWHKALLTYLAGNVDYVKARIASDCPELSVVYGGSSYLLFLNAQNSGMNDAELKRFFVEKARLGLSPGVQYGPGGERHMRLNIGCSRTLLVEAMDRLADAFAQRRQAG